MESKCIEYKWGKEWINSDGYYHRENDLPAIEYNDGYKVWYINRKCHRKIGPAAIYPNGEEEWYLNGVYYSIENMPIKLFLSYLNWELKKKHEI